MATTVTVLPRKSTRSVRRPCGGLAVLGALAAATLLSGCVMPIGARRASAVAVYEQLSQSALTGSVASAETRNVLARHGLLETFADRPEEALASLHAIAGADRREDAVFALAELSYLHALDLSNRVLPARRGKAADFYLAAAVYAYFFMAGNDATAPDRSFDRRIRMASLLYNRAVAEAFADNAGRKGSLSFSAGVRYPLPGPVQLTVRAQHPDYAPESVEAYLPADLLLVRGLSIRNRTYGIGAPLVLSTRDAIGKRRIRWQPATAVLTVSGGLEGWTRETPLTAVLEIHAPGDVIEIDSTRLPVEADTTAPIAQGLSNRELWGLGRLQFLTGVEVFPSGIYAMEPYRPGRIPVVFVHGTMSSPIWWAEMWNTLSADPVLRERYQFWNFVYTSGNPLAVSAGKLRDALSSRVAELDPNGTDAALQRMVIIGHSQGGLLTRMTVTDTGDALWRIASDQDFDTLPVSEKERAALRRTFFYTPLPCVKRVVFIATPHRGSYRVSLLAQSLAQRFVRLPGNVLRTSLDLARLPLKYMPGRPYGTALPNSIAGMSPKNQFLHAIAAMPFPADVRSHSIIAIKDDSEPPEGDDGVVAYQSAHLGQVDSELIVRSKHTCQTKPATIEEVRRILMEHLGSVPR